MTFPPTTVSRRDDAVPQLPTMAEILGALDVPARAEVVARWGLGAIAWQDLPRLLVDRGLLLARARAEGWIRAAATDELIWEDVRSVPSPEVLAPLGLHGDDFAWELVLELGADLGMSNRLAAQLGAEPRDAFDRLLRSSGKRHALLHELHETLLDPARVASAVAALPRAVRLRLAGELTADERALLVDQQLALAADRPCVELAVAAIAAARELEADHQRALLETACRAASPSASRPEIAAAPSTRLRAAALALHASDLDAVRAAERAGLDPHVIALALALRGGDALDQGPAAIVHRGLRFLLSPGAPSRAAGESLLGSAAGQSGPEIAHLAWVTLVQLASLPAMRPCPLASLIELVVADAEALALEFPQLSPRATPELAQRYVLVQIASLHALGLAWPVEREGVAVESETLRAALQQVADAAVPAPSSELARPTVQRDGDALVVEAEDRVPLARLEPLARHVLPIAVGGWLRFRLTPSLLAPAQRAKVIAAVERAVE